ncbi:uncharacterized protein LOC107624165 isoform X3 [Arachis ipaensis]|uniref:uncharacterized protein LOC107624165 isoform X2 n=1 Tax=Arachis ipaensis TaxID=130454 RepID=UPI000A2B97B6|nr:uncharacterized protein LOC107624165 isoform X2 [Arachis ipaensis]XP_020970740.1 uncharacterized protein LOC107624165 isoform X3 [Arachis ipaensis]
MGCFLACFGSSKSKRRKHTHSVQRNATSKPEQPRVSLVQDHSDYGVSDLSDEDEECDEMVEEFEEDRVKIDVDHVVTEGVMESTIQNCESDLKPFGVNPNARDRSAYVHPVLNPVENLTQWKSVKAKRTVSSPLKPQKENYVSPNHESPRIAIAAAEQSVKEVSFHLNSKTDSPKKLSQEISVDESVKEVSFHLNSKTDSPKKLSQEISVDASLSNWLATSSETSTPMNKGSSVSLNSVTTPERSTVSQGSNSVISHDDRPILGALTLEEIKQFSATSSPRKSPSRSPDEMPIIGTVGTYWNFAEEASTASSFKGIPNTTSKYREDKKVNWHSTPFETRLEKALNRGAATKRNACTGLCGFWGVNCLGIQFFYSYEMIQCVMFTSSICSLGK